MALVEGKIWVKLTPAITNTFTVDLFAGDKVLVTISIRERGPHGFYASVYGSNFSQPETFYPWENPPPNLLTVWQAGSDHSSIASASFVTAAGTSYVADLGVWLAESTHTCPEGEHWDDVKGECVPDVTVVTPPPETIEPPKPPKDPLDIFGWLKYIGESIIWFGQNISIVIGNLFSGLWTGIPDWIRKFFTDATTAIGSLVELLTNPQAFMTKVVAGFFTKGSPSLADDVRQGLQDTLTAPWTSAGRKVPEPLSTWFKWQMETLAKDYLPRLIAILEDTSSTPAQILAKLQDLQMSLKGETLALGTWSEAVTIGQIELTAAIGDAVTQLIGLEQAVTLYQQVIVQANIQLRTQQFANEYFKLALPGTDEIIQSRRLENITESAYDELIARAGGLKKEYADLIYRNSLLPPTLDDVVTYAKRYPAKVDEAGGIEAYLQKWAAIVNLDALPPPAGRADYRPVFKERFYVDPSITQARFLWETGAIEDESQIEDIVRLNLLPEKWIKPMTEYITKFQERRWLYQELTRAKTAYAYDIISEAQLRELAADAHLRGPAQDAIVATGNLQRKVAEFTKPKGSKPFTVPELVKYQKAGVIDEGFITTDVEAYGYDEAHTKAIKDYIKGAVVTEEAPA